MSRTLVRLAILLAVIALPPISLRAQAPTKDAGTNPDQGTLTVSGQGTLILAGSNAYSGGATADSGSSNNAAGATVLSSGTVTVRGDWSQSPVATLQFTNSDATWNTLNLNGAGATAPRTPPAPIPAGPVFYIIVEGAGLGDSVRTVPCTGKETVLHAVGAVSGISQVSGTKTWVARPSPKKGDQGSILPVDWEAISKRGINTTNYTLMPGDRLVFGEDPLAARNNLLSKKTAPVERIEGLVGLTTSTVSGLRSTPGAAEMVKELVQKGYFTDDAGLKMILLDALDRDGGAAKAGPKAAEAQKAGQAEEKPVTFCLKVSAGPVPKQEGQAKQGSKEAGEAPPHELAMRSLPAYRIEPPDVIQIEMLKLVPKPPYRAEVFDVFQVRVANTLRDQPIDNQYMIGADGTINLGPAYGTVRVVGMTIDEIKRAINLKLHEVLRNSEVSVQLTRVAGAQPVTGQYLVGPDGTINLRQYGVVHVAGMTVTEARIGIQNRLKQYLDSPELAVSVVAYNSKVYYVIIQGAGMGDSVRRFPATGNETVLDAISHVNGLSQLSSKKIWIARPAPQKSGCQQILPVDWEAITQRAQTATNYQVFPSDRVFIAEDPVIARTNLMATKTGHIERMMGLIGLTTSIIGGLNGTPGADEVVKELVRKGIITDDEEMKKIVLDAIRRDEESKKAAGKAAAGQKPGQ